MYFLVHVVVVVVVDVDVVAVTQLLPASSDRYCMGLWEVCIRLCCRDPSCVEMTGAADRNRFQRHVLDGADDWQRSAKG